MISVYAVDISTMSPMTYETLYAAASQERRQRADQCRDREDAACCLTAEALLRFALKAHLSLTCYELEYGSHGKPGVKGHEEFCFNLSHSGHWVVLACGDTPVGIDVEKLRMDAKKERIARRFFTAKEQNFIFCDDETDRRFFQIWTAKESYLKYLGKGLQKSLDSFCVCTMENPHFFTNWLDDSCMTLCTTDTAYQLEQLRTEQLTETKGE